MSDKPDRSDKFAYTSRDQIVTGKDRERAKEEARARRKTDRSDKFAYTSPNQIVTDPVEKERAKARARLRRLTGAERIDPVKLLALVEKNLDTLRIDEQQDLFDDEA